MTRRTYPPTPLTAAERATKESLMPATATKTPLKACTTLTLHAHCPHCGTDLCTVPTPATFEKPDYYDNNWDGGRGAYVTACESCGEPFAIPADVVQDAQHACLVILGEA